MRQRMTLILALLLLLLFALPAGAEQAHTDLLPNAGEQAPADTALPTDISQDVPIENGIDGIGPLTQPNDSYPAPLTEEWLARQDRVQGTGTVADLEKHWATVGWPDDVSYAYCSGGMLEEDTVYDFWEIGLVDDDEARRAEIAALASPNCLLTFFDCTCSYAQRQSILAEIQALSDPQIQQVFLGRNTEFVFVVVDESKAEHYQQVFFAQYGDVVQVTDQLATADDAFTAFPGGGAGADSGGGTAAGIDGNPATPSAPLWLFFILLAAILCLGLALLPRRRAAALTSAGTLADGTPLSRTQVERLIRSDIHVPSPQVLSRIQTKLDR